MGSNETPADQAFVLGVNYWPRRKAMYWWKDFDATEVDEEFSVLQSLQLQVVRIFLLWEDFQPRPEYVSEDALNNLRTVCGLASKHNLKLNVTFFTGHMSGPNWAPGWLLDASADVPTPNLRQLVSGGKVVESGYRNPYTDPVALEAERLLLRTVVSALKDHPAVWVWNLGNEPDLFAWAPDAATGQRWVREMRAFIGELDPTHEVGCGLHAGNLLADTGLRVDRVFAETDYAAMHAYPMYTSFVRHPLDPDYVPFTCALTTALSGKPTLMEEWGGCTTAPGTPSEVWEWTAYGRSRKQFMASEEDLAQYVEQVLPKLLEVGATGSILWCYADYSQELWDRPPCDESRHERFFGLVRPDGSLKPHAEVIKRFAGTKPTVQAPRRTVTLDISPETFYQDPASHTERLFRAYIEADSPE